MQYLTTLENRTFFFIGNDLFILKLLNGLGPWSQSSNGSHRRLCTINCNSFYSFWKKKLFSSVDRVIFMTHTNVWPVGFTLTQKIKKRAVKRHSDIPFFLKRSKKEKNFFPFLWTVPSNSFRRIFRNWFFSYVSA